MNKKQIQDELKRFETILGKTSLTAEQKGKYLEIKKNLLNQEATSHYWASGKTGMITRYRHGAPVWYGSEVEDELYTGVESRRIQGLSKIGELTVYMPSKSADKFQPSSFLALQQVGFSRDVKHPVLVEFRFGSPDVAANYDRILQCHAVTAILYHDVQHTLQELEQEHNWLDTCLRNRPQITL